MQLPSKLKPSMPQWLPEIAIIFFIVSITLIWLLFAFEKIYADKIYPGIWLGRVDLSGHTKEQAQSIISNTVDQINQSGIIFYYNQEQVTILPTITSTESDFAYQIIDLKVNETIDQAYALGRNSDFFTNLKNKIKTWAFKRPLNLIVEINQDEVKKILVENFSQLDMPAENAKLIKDQNNNYLVSEEKFGKIIDYEKALKQLKHNLSQVSNASVELLTSTDYPEIYKKDCLNTDSKAKQVLSLAPLTLKYDNRQWIIYKNQLDGWLTLKINSETSSTEKEDKVIVGLDKEVVEKYLEDIIASTTDRVPVEAKFEIKDGRVLEFQGSRDGFKLNLAASFNEMKIALKEKKSQIELIKTELKSKVHTTDINDFGISEIIGIGESSFAGSPANRRHNIRNGANSLNGILIKPDEEFSLNNALGEIDATTGYLPELVIKGNQTIAEYGGGLCQIGTTMFRVALATGLPITHRRNHSYRVRYYEPAGTDATIYSPWPDMKFINDTSNYILIQSRIEGDDLYFDFWGTSDGRTVEMTESVIYNITKPNPTKYIETLDLEPGKKKCTEHAVNGADAYFDYKVTYSNEEIKERRFSSHYVPWQEVCLIGVEELSKDEEDNETEDDSAEKQEVEE